MFLCNDDYSCSPGLGYEMSEMRNDISARPIPFFCKVDKCVLSMFINAYRSISLVTISTSSAFNPDLGVALVTHFK